MRQWHSVLEIRTARRGLTEITRELLGTWQGIYLYEHRHRGHVREVVLHLLGD